MGKYVDLDKLVFEPDENGFGGLRMYIPEFWCGVAATIICEILLLIMVAIWSYPKGSQKH